MAVYVPESGGRRRVPGEITQFWLLWTALGGDGLPRAQSGRVCRIVPRLELAAG